MNPTDFSNLCVEICYDEEAITKDVHDLFKYLNTYFKTYISNDLAHKSDDRLYLAYYLHSEIFKIAILKIPNVKLYGCHDEGGIGGISDVWPKMDTSAAAAVAAAAAAAGAGAGAVAAGAAGAAESAGAAGAAESDSDGMSPSNSNSESS